MRYYLSIITLLFALNTSAQKKAKTIVVPKPAALAVVKGHIDNHDGMSLEYWWANLIGTTSASIPVNKSGDFILRMRIENTVKETVIYFGDEEVKLDLVNKDTVTLNIDAKDFKTLKITANSATRTVELNKAHANRQRFYNQYYKLKVAQRKERSDTVRYANIIALYNKEIDWLLQDVAVTPGIAKTAADIYFNYVDLLFYAGLLPDHDLVITHPTVATRAISILNTPFAFRRELKPYYKTSRSYRDFIFNYVRLRPTFQLWPTKGIKAPDDARSNAWKECYKGLDVFTDTEIKDWYVARSIVEDFQFFSFDDATAVYTDFLPQIKTVLYTDTLKKFYNSIRHLKPGSPAPIFTLKDDNGKKVSLSNFKGKLVYIDFWGVYCGPCVGAIKADVPGLHKKYKDKDIVFVNICIDTDEANWKANLKKLDLEGVNLIALGSTKNPVNKAYNIDAIPHYYLIDTEGKIIDNNAADPGSRRLNEQLDKLLK